MSEKERVVNDPELFIFISTGDNKIAQVMLSTEQMEAVKSIMIAMTDGKLNIGKETTVAFGGDRK